MVRWPCLVVPLLLAGCPQYSTYGYQYKVQQEFTGGEEPEAAPVEARQLLASAKTVAFYPPDSCINTDTNVDRKRIQELHASCGVLMSSLERAAEKAGYEVLSWQNLKGGKRAIEYAREANVDVLFEINEFDPQVLTDTDLQHTLAFFEDTDAGQQPLQVSTPLAQTCAQYAIQADPPKAAALTGSIDIKTVSVVDGRDRWHYRKTQQVSLGRTYPQVRFRAMQGENRAANALFVAGSVAIGIGGALAIVEAVSTDDPTTPTVNEKFDSGGWSTGLLVAGVAAMAAGTAVHYGAGGRKPEPEKVLCDGKLAVVDAPPQVVQVGAMSAEHTFSQTSHGDELATAKKQIEEQMVAQFIQELTDARAARTRTPAPPEAPSAPSPQAALPPAPAMPAPAKP